jgi:hypothetical protein
VILAKVLEELIERDPHASKQAGGTTEYFA